MRWRREHAGHHSTRIGHLADSLVYLRAFIQSRSSSRKSRRSLARINTLTLAANVQLLWAYYIHPYRTPSNTRSRWGRRIKIEFRHAKA